MRVFEEKPAEGQSFEDWFEFRDLIDDLQADFREEILVHRVSRGQHFAEYQAAFLLPQAVIRPEIGRQLAAWNLDPLEQGWGYGYSFDDDGQPDFHLDAPFEDTTPEVLRSGIPIIWRRYSDLGREPDTYIEANPQLTHVLDVHWSEAHSAYCKLDELGDIREVIRVVSADESPRLVTIREAELAWFMALGDYALVRLFSFDRYESEAYLQPPRLQHRQSTWFEEEGITARRIPFTGGSCLRGVQIVPAPRGGVKRDLLDDRQTRRRETFLALDWRNRKVAEVGCAPISPAFFRREVLTRYQADTDKYRAEDRRISCRGGWSISYDVNDEEQVHVYLKDIQRLPFPEQQYWKSFNEAPRAGISRRARTTDFEGNWDLEPEPLRDLKALLRNSLSVHLPDGGAVEIWSPPDDRASLEAIHYLSTKGEKEWAGEIGALHRLVVEGLETANLRQAVLAHGGEAKELKKLKSIRLLESLLVGMGYAEDLISRIVIPLGELNHFRSKTSAHRKGADAKELIRKAKREHRDLAGHFKSLVASVYHGMAELAGLIAEEEES